MPDRPVRLRSAEDSSAGAALRSRIDALVAKAELPAQFAPDALADAERAAARTPPQDRVDLCDVPFVTLDPQSSTDLDQAMHLERTEGGYRVRYAIADVPFFVDLDGSIDAEARRRGATVYLPDRRIPLHPPVLSEASASILPEQDTPVFVWDLALDAHGEVTDVGLERAVIRSVAKLAYDTVQDEIDAGGGHEQMLLLQEIGELRIQLEAGRGGASLNVPEQEARASDGQIRLHWRSPRPIEDANAQISLLTGMAAARVMIDGGAGILRTMPPAEESAIARFRRQADALRTPWPADVDYGTFLRGLDWREGRHLALLNQATTLFRGAGYAAFTAPEQVPEDPRQSAIGAAYAHTTAPLRRLVDRFVLLTCHAHLQQVPVPPELLAALPLLPEIMQETGSRAGSLERAAVDLVEAAALAPLVGDELVGTVIEHREASGDGEESRPARVEVQVVDPPIAAWAEGEAELGSAVRVRIDAVDAEKAQLSLSVLGPAA